MVVTLVVVSLVTPIDICQEGCWGGPAGSATTDSGLLLTLSLTFRNHGKFDLFSSILGL